MPHHAHFIAELLRTEITLIKGLAEGLVHRKVTLSDAFRTCLKI